MSRVTFSPLPQGRHELRPALEAARLPTDDLDQPGRAFFELSDELGPVGFVGIGGGGPARLLRSLVLLPSRKRQGHGGLLVEHAEAVARRDSVRRLQLLKTTVADFFRTRGYRPAERGDAPASIIGTAQFTSLCPSSAAYHVKDLA